MNIENKKIYNLKESWLNGEDVNWGELYEGKKIPNRINLPHQLLEEKMIQSVEYYTEESTVERQESYNEVCVDREKSLCDKIISLTSSILYMSESEIELDKAFAEYGLDSVKGVELLGRLNKELKIQLSPTDLYDYSTAEQLSNYIIKNFGVNNDVAKTEVKSKEESVITVEKHPIAIIGVSGRFAKSENLEELWEHLENGDNLVDKISKWDVESHGSFIDSIEEFDPLFFNISGLEATYMDPQQRLFMEESWKALEDAGYAGKSIEGKKCGVFVGSTIGDYQDLFEENIPAQALWGNMNSIIPTRMSYFLNLKGPAISVDTACSSSLVAIHLACQSIWNDESEMALAGGVFLQCTPKMFYSGDKGGMLSATGCCHTFDESADGFVPGDGVGVIVLKPLRKALEDHDNIYATIIGSGINQDGATNGITAPNSKAQEDLEKNIYEKFSIDPDTIQMIEAHGTGTKLGDPIEVQALTRAFRSFTNDRNYCAIGSIKTNIGHAQHAAGIASIIKILLSFKHRKIPASLHYEKCNPNINFKESPFYVNTQLSSWRNKNIPLRAAVSSFGFSGTNAHLVLEEGNISREKHNKRREYLVVLSAQTEKQLEILVEDVIKKCKNEQIDCGNLSYTLLSGRRHFKNRLACIVYDSEQLLSCLQSWLSGNDSVVTYNNGKLTKKIKGSEIEDGNSKIEEFISQGLNHDYLKRIGEMFCYGYDLNYNMLFCDNKYYKISLPVYPFLKDKYWIVENDQKVIHPFLQYFNNNNNLLQFSSSFSGEEFVLKNHTVNSNHILPGSAYIEMFYAGAVYLNQALKNCIRLKNITFIQPVTIENGDNDIFMDIIFKSDIETKFSICTKDHSKLFCEGTFSILSKDEINSFEYLDNTSYKKIEFDKFRFYNELAKMGIVYGSCYQCIEEVYKNGTIILTKISLPNIVEDSFIDYNIHPCMLDSVFQSIILAISQNTDISNVSPALLFSVGEILVYGKMTKEIWALTMKSDENDNQSMQKFNIKLFDEEGKNIVRMTKVSAKTMPKMNRPSNENQELMYLVPRWKIEDVKFLEEEINLNRTLLLRSFYNEFNKIIEDNYKNSEIIHIFKSDLENDYNEIINKFSNLTDVVWLESDSNDITGIKKMMSFVKVLLNFGYGEKKLNWTILTIKAQNISERQDINPYIAALHGFIGSMAKECQNWNMRLFDFENEDILTKKWNEAKSISFNKRGNSLVYRDENWFVQEMIPVKLTQSNKKSIIQNGIYIIVGGAGGLGYGLTTLLIKKYNATVIWLGRSKINKKIEEKIASFNLTNHPHYYSVDAANEIELRQIVEEIKNNYGRINGVLHAAQIFYVASIYQAEIEEYEKSMASKVNVAVSIGKVFEEEKLDFLLFFSSTNSYSKAPEQSAYSASCTFLDAYTRFLAKKVEYDVKVMNWGYYKNNIEQAIYLEKVGHLLLDENDLLNGINILLNEKFIQMSCVKVNSENAIRGLNLSSIEGKKNDKKSSAAISKKANIEKPVFSLDEATVNEKAYIQFENMLLELVYSELISGLIFENGMTCEQLINANNIKGFYQRWFAETMKILILKEYVMNKEDYFYQNPHKVLDEKNILWENWENVKKNTWYDSPELIAQVKLVEPLIVNLLQIITGKVLATQIMFSNSSISLVENVYKTNKNGKYFNELLACYVVDIIKNIIARKDNSKIRILEIGAGTGGTSEVVFEKIKKFTECIEEYCYTDISKAFLLHAEDNYREDNPFLQCKLLNIEEEPRNQEFSEGNYDLVIASNCLHATRDISLSIRNAKSLLKENGILLLNEMSGNNFFAHMTFGMLEGWWLYKDTYLRIEGCPGIYKNTWKNILLSEGLVDVYFPYDINYDAKQEIIISKSNGIVYQDKIIAEDEVKKENKEQEHKATNTNKVFYDNSVIEKKVKEELKVEIAKSLQIDANKIEEDGELSDYGIDSIISVNLISQFNNALELELESTILFEYTTLIDLTKYIVDSYLEKLMTKYNITNMPNKEVSVDKSFSFDTGMDSGNYISGEEESFIETISEFDLIDEKIAIIGFSAKFPMADDVEEFWCNIVNHKKCFHELSKERKELILTQSRKKIQSKYAGFISKIDEFNPRDFGLSEDEAVLYSPEFRLLLMYVNKAIEDAGITSKNIRNEKIGLFISVNPSDYKTNQSGQTKIFTNMSGSLMANQISYILNLNGPSECCENGCSSAIVAIHRAGQSLKNRECDIAIVAAVNLLLSGNGFVNMEELGLLSVDGDSKPYQNNANGFLRSEGIGAIVLKSYLSALDSHCNICSIIRGSAVGHGGKSASFATPSLSGMRGIIIDAYKKSNISFEDIDYIEAHGIGNSISDSIEIGAIKSAYKVLNSESNEIKKIAISCLKPNIGHGEVFSGISAIIKVILAMKNKIIPGIIDFTDPADAINLVDTPFTISNKNSEWKKVNGKTRLASINSYGLGGVNAHIVLEEYKEIRVSENKNCTRLFVISANTKEDLYQNINNLIIHLKTHKYDLADIEYTLKMGRNMRKERFAVIADDEQQLIERMEVFLEIKERNSEFVFYGKIDKKETVINEFFSDDIKNVLLTMLQERKNLKKLALYWTNIDDIEWETILEKENTKIVSLPPYPYLCQSYWYTTGNAQNSVNDSEFQISTKLTEIISEYVGLKNNEFDMNKTLKEYGVDSIRIIPLLQKIQNATLSNFSLKDIEIEQPINEMIYKLEKLFNEKENTYMGTMSSMNNYSELVKLNSIEKGNPIFWIHAALGGVEPYIEIADKIDRPFWGIQARGWLTDKEPIRGMNEMAAYYAQIIQNVQPEGPYDIGGFCIGGILAYEVTRLLQGRGYKINTLVMVDSPDNTFQQKMRETPQGNDAKGIIFQTVNMLLYSQLKDSKKNDKFFIADKELNLKVADEEFIFQVSKLATSHGLLMKEDKIVSILKNNIAVQSSYLLHEYKINSLNKKNDIKCFYFRNTRGVFEGSLRKYICLPNNEFDFDNQIYWEGWKQEINNIEIIDVDAASHMTLLNEPDSVKVILDKCKKIY